MESRNGMYWSAVVLAVLALVAAWIGHRVERDFGRVEVETLSFMTTEMQPMVAKLYRPRTATADNPAPGLLALHGYQSDKEATSTFGALELARRGYVVLAIDQFGHGFSTRAPARNKTMSGADHGYQYLKRLPFVDPARLGIFGHSTGALNAVRVARQNPDHRAVNGQSSNGGEMEGLNNYLLTQGLYEEIGPYREKTFPVKDLVRHEKRLAAFGLPADGELAWNHTYGRFEDGTARRADLVPATHLGVMVSAQTNQHAIDWFDEAMNHHQRVVGFTYWYKELAGLASLLLALASALCLANGLLGTRYFGVARHPIDPLVPLRGRAWWRGALFNIVLTMLLYPLLTQWGGANEPMAARLPWMPLEMGNGLITWLLGTAAIGLVCFVVWIVAQRGRLRPYQLGLGAHPAHRSGSKIWERSLILAGVLFVYLYALTLFIHSVTGQELRFLWPLLKPMTVERWQLFPVYWGLILLAFLVINGLVLTAQFKQPTGHGFLADWLRWSAATIVMAVGGLLLLWCAHFLPGYLQWGPGFDLIGLPQFGGRWMMMLPVVMAQFSAMIVINHWCYLKTGYIWLGVFFTSLLMAWMLVGGQVIGRFMA
ncbi:MAG: alpha/beta hydrolase [Lautropia sp.]|nr:alpha/beta hydrolase [Lautropia sp.]